MTKKLLYSPGFGAGWTTWEGDSKVVQFMASYQPIIDFIEGGGKFDTTEVRYAPDNEKPDLSELHPVLRQFAEDCWERFKNIPYLGGARDLKVYECDDNVRVRFDEYDGSESVITDGDEWAWF